MVSRDYIKYNKDKLRIKKIKGNLLAHYIKTGTGKNDRRKFLLIPSYKNKEIRKREIDEIVNLILHRRKFKIQKEIIKKRVPVADRRLKWKLGIELSSTDLYKIFCKIKTFSYKSQNKKILDYVLKLVNKRKMEERLLQKHRMKHTKKIKSLNLDRKYLTKKELRKYFK